MVKLTEQRILELEEDLEDIQLMLDRCWLDDLATIKDLGNKKHIILTKLGRVKEREYKHRWKFYDYN